MYFLMKKPAGHSRCLGCPGWTTWDLAHALLNYFLDLQTRCSFLQRKVTQTTAFIWDLWIPGLYGSRNVWTTQHSPRRPCPEWTVGPLDSEAADRRAPSVPGQALRVHQGHPIWVKTLGQKGCDPGGDWWCKEAPGNSIVK